MLSLPWLFTLIPHLLPVVQGAAIPFELTLTFQLANSSAPSWNSTYTTSSSSSFLNVSSTSTSSTSTIASVSSSSSTASSAASTSTPVAPLVLNTEGTDVNSATTLDDIQTIRERRLAVIAEDVVDPLVGTISNISDWVSTLGQDGKWPASEVDYSTGCDGQKANWPAELHWQRIAFMAAAWQGGVQGADNFAQNSTVLNAISRAMDFWFSNDFTDSDCLNGGCKCGTPGFWNTNWFSNVIAIPTLVGESCLLVGADQLSDTQRSNCTHFTQRTGTTLVTGVARIGQMTGANTLDVAKVAIDGALLTNDTAAVTAAYQHVHDEVLVRSAVKADGIKADGSFSQHKGLLYNGNYGKDYANDVLALEIAAGGTQFSAQKSSTDSQTAFESLWDADLWMIYRNVKTNVLHFDFSALNRFITFPVADDQATASIQVNISRIQQLGEEWNSDTLQNVYASLSSPSADANSGNITGNRMFYANDYMVQRGPGYVSTLKMFSSRTENSECTNEENPYGFHLSDGTLYTYLDGTQYEDIAGAWDWNLIPGTTTDYAATNLSCDASRLSSSEDFVGGASNDKVGAAAMRYKNPSTGALSFQKAWFFLEDDVQYIMVSQVESNSSATNPVISVLDQKRLNGPVYVDGQQIDKGGNFSQISSLWHDNVGYTFGSNSTSQKAEVSVDFGTRESDWAPIGISQAPNSTVDLFSAWITHGSGSDLAVPFAYMAFPAVAANDFQQKSQSTNISVIQNDADVSAVYDAVHHTAMFVFWSTEGGSTTYNPPDANGFLAMKASGNCAIIYDMDNKTITVSDPSQTLTDVKVTVMTSVLDSQTFDITLPTGGEAGKSVTQQLS